MQIGRQIALLALAILVGLSVTACATSSEATGDELDPTKRYIVVDNTNTAISSATIFLDPETGVRERLGTVTLNEERTFEVPGTVDTRFRLVADHGVQEITSRPFTLGQGEVVEWELDLNQIIYRGEIGRR